MPCLAKSTQGICGRRTYMWEVMFLAAAVSLIAAPAAADIFRYIDDDGVIHYTDDIDRVPAKYKDSVQQQKSVRREASPRAEGMRRQSPLVVSTGEAPPEKASPDETSEVQPGEAEAAPEEAMGDGSQESAGDEGLESAPEIEEGSEGQPPESLSEGEEAAGESADFRRRLEEERQALLERKEALENDPSSQKPSIKDKYITRPQVQEIAEEGARIDLRLGEIEEQLRQ